MFQQQRKKSRKGQIILYVLLLLIVAGAMTAIRYTAGKQPHRHHRGEGADTIHAAVVYGPGSFRVLESEDGNDSVTGVNYDLLTLLQDSLGVVVVKHPVVDRDDALRKVAKGKYDILASLPADNYLKKKYLTSDEVYLDRLVLIQKKGADGSLKAKSALDLENDTVHTERGSAATRRLENLQKEIGGTIHVKEEEGISEEHLAMKVGIGDWDFAVVNELTAQEMLKLYPDLDFSTLVSFTQFQVWVLSLGNDSLLKKVNKFLKDTDKTGKRVAK